MSSIQRKLFPTGKPLGQLPHHSASQGQASPTTFAFPLIRLFLLRRSTQVHIAFCFLLSHTDDTGSTDLRFTANISSSPRCSSVASSLPEKSSHFGILLLGVWAKGNLFKHVLFDLIVRHHVCNLNQFGVQFVDHGVPQALSHCRISELGLCLLFHPLDHIFSRNDPLDVASTFFHLLACIRILSRRNTEAT